MKRTPSAKAPVLPDQCLKCHRETVWWSQVKFIKLLGLALYFKKEEFHLHYCTLWCYKSNRRFDSVRAHTVSMKERPAPASYQRIFTPRLLVILSMIRGYEKDDFLYRLPSFSFLSLFSTSGEGYFTSCIAIHNLATASSEVIYQSVSIISS